MTDKRMTIYINDSDREEINALSQVLSAKGIKLSNKPGKESVSALFRYLRQKELANEKPSNK